MSESRWLTEALNFLLMDRDIHSLHFIKETLNKTQQIFVYDNLPLTLPQEELERLLQEEGEAFVTLHDGQLYAFSSSKTGKPDVYHRPTEVIVTSEALGINGKHYKIGIDGVLFKNTSNSMSLLSKIGQYAAFQTDAILSLRQAVINMRDPLLFEAVDLADYESAIETIRQYEEGKSGIIQTDTLSNDGVLQPIHRVGSGQNNIVPLLEAMQYMKSSFYGDLGININEHMKSQYVNEGEMALNERATMPLIDNMLDCRQRAIDELNALFDLEVTIKLSKPWEDNVEEVEVLLPDHNGDGVINEEDEKIDDALNEETEETEEVEEKGEDLNPNEVADSYREMSGDESKTDELEVINNEATNPESDTGGVETEETLDEETESEASKDSNPKKSNDTNDDDDD